MFDSIVNTINRIIDLLGKGSQAKKRRLEIQKLEHELKEAKSIIEKPTAEEIQKYDPKLQELFKRIENDIYHFHYRCELENESDVEDVFQEVFQRVYTDLRRVNKDLSRKFPHSHVTQRKQSKQRSPAASTKPHVPQKIHKSYPRRRSN